MYERIKRKKRKIKMNPNGNQILHGHNCRGKASPTYRSWRSMKARCLYQKHPQSPETLPSQCTVCFPIKTWVQFHELYEFDFNKLMHSRHKGDLEFIGQLTASTINAIINCIKRSERERICLITLYCLQ